MAITIHREAQYNFTQNTRAEMGLGSEILH